MAVEDAAAGDVAVGGVEDAAAVAVEVAASPVGIDSAIKEFV